MGAALDSGLQLRVGVNTGEVLIGGMRAAGDWTAMGDTVNTANRLQVLAEPGTVVVGADTYAATVNAVRYTPLGALAAKGRAEPVEAWVAEETVAPPGRAEPPVRRPHRGPRRRALRARAPHPRRHLPQPRHHRGGHRRGGHGQDPPRRGGGVPRRGRGRCASCSRVPASPTARPTCGGRSPTPSAPRSGAPVGTPSATLRTHCRAWVELALPAAGEQQRELVTEGLLHLLGEHSTLAGIDPGRAREEVSRSVVSVVEGLAAQRPVVVVLSDVHWADDAVLSLGATLMERCAHLPVVILATARAGLLERWRPTVDRSNQLILHLDPLNRDDTAALLEELASDLPADVRDLVLDRSGGNPFFLEELVRLFEDGGRTEVPHTLRGLVAARLDSLTPLERKVVESAAILGRHFPRMAVQLMAGGKEAAADKELGEPSAGTASVDAAIAELEAKDLLVDDARRHPRLPVRPRARGRLRHPHQGGTRPGPLRGGRLDRAPPPHAPRPTATGSPTTTPPPPRWWPRSARSRACPSTWAIGPWRRWPTPSSTPCPSTSTPRPSAWPARPSSCPRTRSAPPTRPGSWCGGPACGSAGATPTSHRRRPTSPPPSCWSTRAAPRSSWPRCSWPRASSSCAAATTPGPSTCWARRSRCSGPSAARPGEARALQSLGTAHLFGGEHVEAHTAFVEALDKSREVGDRRGAAWATQNLAWVAYSAGQIDAAERYCAESRDTFESLGDRTGTAWADGLMGFVRYHQGRFAEAEALADQMLDLAHERDDPWANAMMLTLRGSLRLWTGRSAQAIEPAEQALAKFRSMGDWYGHLLAIAVVGRALVAQGRIEEGFAHVDEGVAVGGTTTSRLGPDIAAVHVVTSAAQAGRPDRVEGIELFTAGDLDLHDMGFSDRAVSDGLVHLQRGDAEAARDLLEALVDGLGERSSSYAFAALALARAAAGDLDAADAAASAVCGTTGATHSDRVMAHTSLGLVSARRGDPAGADAALGDVREILEGTDERLGLGLLGLASATADEALGRPVGPGAGVEAAADSPGWLVAYRLVAGLS